MGCAFYAGLAGDFVAGVLGVLVVLRRWKDEGGACLR